MTQTHQQSQRTLRWVWGLLEDRAASFVPSPPSSTYSITQGCKLDLQVPDSQS